MIDSMTYKLGRFIIRKFFLGKAKITVKGSFPKKAAIIVASHDNPWDPPLIMIAAKKFVHFFTANMLFKDRLQRFFLRFIGQIPVQSGLKQMNQRAFSEAASYLRKGELVGIFPYPDDMIKKKKVLYTGVIRLIMENDAPVIPVRVKLKEYRKWKSFFDVNFNEAIIIIGDPLDGLRERCIKNRGHEHCLSLAKELVEHIESLK